MRDNLLERLRDWKTVWPDDDEKPDGHLYLEASDRIEQLEAKLTRCEKYRDAYMECDRISTQAVRELEDVLREVDAWVDDLLPYAREGQEPATVFKRVKEVLSKC